MTALGTFLWYTDSIKYRKEYKLLEAKQNWHSLSQASRILGKDRSYVSKWLIRHETLPDNMVMEIGNAKVINDSGIQWIIEHTKKEDVHISSCVLIVDKFLKLTVLGKYPTYHFTCEGSTTLARV